MNDIKKTKKTRHETSLEMEREIKRMNTRTLLWIVVKRHKFGLVTAWAVTITLLWIFPPLPDLILSMF